MKANLVIIVPSDPTGTLEEVGANKEETGSHSQQDTTPSPVAFITRSAAKKAAKIAAKLKSKEPPDLISDIKLTRGGSNKAGQQRNQKNFAKSSYHKSGK